MKISVVDTPGPSALEFLMQWAGVVTQAGAALGTVWAVVVALRVAGAQAKWREQDIARESAIVAVVVNRELKSLEQPLSMLIYQFAGGKQLSDLERVPANPQNIAAICREKLTMPRTWALVDKVGYVPRAQDIAHVLAELSILTQACEFIEKKSGAGFVIEAEDVWSVGGVAHILDFYRRKALGETIDAKLFPYQ